MAAKTTTTYSCDGCGKTKKQRELRKFTLTERTMTGTARDIVAEAKTDLCTDCELKLHETALPLWPETERAKMAGIVRG